MQSCWEGSRRCHDGEVAPGHVAGKTIPYRRTCCGTKGVIRSRAVKAMPEETTLDDLDAIKGSPWAPTGVFRDVLPDVPRPMLSRDEPPFLPVKERPVPRNMLISQDILRKIGYTPGCAKMQDTVAQRVFPFQAWHTRRIVVSGLRQQVGLTVCIVIDLSEQNSERWISTQRKVERIDHPRRASLEPSVVPGPPTGKTEIPRSDPEGEDHSTAPDAKQARWEPERDLLGEIRSPSADETLTPPEIPAVPSGSTSSSSTSIRISPVASSSSGVKRTYSESTALPNLPGVSSGSALKCAYGNSIVNGDKEQPGTRALDFSSDCRSTRCECCGT